MTTDALDRAAQAAWETHQPPPTAWADAPKRTRKCYRAEAAAALGVLITDLREVLHADRPAAMRVVQAVVILDRYTQSGTDNGGAS